MKKFLIAAFVLIHTPNVLAAEPFKLYCITEFPTTSFLIEEQGDKINARVIHHNGSKWAPMYNGMITPEDLNTLKPRAEATKKLPMDESFSWPKEKCTFHENMRFECYGSKDEKTVDGVKLEPWSLYSSLIDHDNVAGKYREIEMAFSIRVDGVDTTISMQYPIEACRRVLEPGRLSH